MIDISGHLRPCRRDLGYRVEDRPLVINCCGYQRFFKQDLLRTRPAGREDYQLLYLQEGKGTFLLDGEYREVRAGEIVLYRPGEPQSYSYRHGDTPRVYWIHFTGSEAEKWLQTFEISTGYVGKSQEIQKIFEEIVLELTLKKKNFHVIAASHFLRLLALLQRLRQEQESGDSRLGSIDGLILSLNQRYQQSWTVESMARFCMLSPGYFAHSFKARTHMAPLQYLTDLRMSKAKEFLVNTDMSVSAIAGAVGYENPLYFSRLFRKNAGISPRAYREQGEQQEA